MNSTDFNNKSVEELLKSSKQLQNKIRKEFKLQAKEFPVVSELQKPEPLSTSWDNATLKTCEDNAVVDSFQLTNKSRLSKKSNILNEKPLRGVKIITQPLLLDSNKKVDVTGSFPSFKKSLASADKPSKKLCSPVSSNAKLKTNQNVNVNESSKISLQSKKLLATSSCRLPLQRFAESTNKNIDFFKEHPHLELDMTSKQTTLFPRRFHRSTECVSKNDDECLNVLEAEFKPPQITPEVVISDTWNGILKKNKPSTKGTQKIVRLKKIKENVFAAPVPQIQKPEESYDVIASSPSKGFYKLQKKSQHLAEHKKCNIERFPVLYIRPECKVQKVTNISICGKTESVLGSTAEENHTSNVRYIECRHEDGEKTFEPKIILDETAIDKKEKGTTEMEDNATSGNKFFKALEFNYLHEHFATSSESSPLERESISSRRSFSSISSSSSSLKNVNPTSTANEIQHSVRSASDSPLLNRNEKNTIENSQSRCGEVLKSRCEVYVQTEKECQQSILKITSPLQNQAKSSSQSELPTSINNNDDDSLKKTAPLQRLEYPAEDDIIAKIFQRILNDLPDALDKFNNRNNFTTNGTTSISKNCPSKNEHNQEENNQEYQNPTPVPNEGLNVSKLFPTEKEKIKEVNLSNNSSTSTLGEQRETFLQQNSLFVKTLKGIKTDNKRRNPVKQKCPKEAEIKRAVKIFLDSLTFNGNVEKNAILKNTCTENRSVTLPELKLIGSDKPEKYPHSDSSSTSNSLTGINEMARKVKRNKNRTVFRSDVSGSSTSIDLSSTDLDLESDTTDNMSSISSTKTKNTSEGEVKSIGEI